MFQVFPVTLLGDFGLCAPLKEAHTHGIGSAGYVAPVNTLRGPGVVSEREADLQSLGGTS